MKKYLRKSKTIEKYLEIVLKAIPVFVTFFFVGSVFFNFGYFRNVNLSLISLLSLSDYYEGSLFSLYHIFIIIFSLLMLNCLWNALLSLWDIRKQFLKAKSIYADIKTKSSTIKMKVTSMINELEKIRYGEEKKKELKSLLEEEKQEFKETQEMFTNLKIKLIKETAKILLILLCISLSIATRIYCVYLFNLSLVIMIGILFVVFKLQQKYKFSKKTLLFIFLFGYPFVMFSLGNLLVFAKPGKGINCLAKICPIQSKVYVNIEKEQYQLMRLISRGVLVKKENEILFFKWEDVENLYQQKAN